jgi:hypothetical protein
LRTWDRGSCRGRLCVAAWAASQAACEGGGGRAPAAAAAAASDAAPDLAGGGDGADAGAGDAPAPDQGGWRAAGGLACEEGPGFDFAVEVDDAAWGEGPAFEDRDAVVTGSVTAVLDDGVEVDVGKYDARIRLAVPGRSLGYPEVGSGVEITRCWYFLSEGGLLAYLVRLDGELWAFYSLVIDLPAGRACDVGIAARGRDSGCAWRYSDEGQCADRVGDLEIEVGESRVLLRSGESAVDEATGLVAAAVVYEGHPVLACDDGWEKTDEGFFTGEGRVVDPEP